MALLIYTPIHDAHEWAETLRAALPGLDVRIVPDIGDPAEIDMALVWKPAKGLLASLPNLKFVQSFGAGVDNILADGSYPRHVPLARVVDAGLADGMAEYVTLHVLRYHRQMDTMQRNQRTGTWKWLPPIAAAERTVGIMGLGALGEAAARKVAGFGFQVVGWSRRLKAIDGVASFHGPDHLEGFLRLCNILVCLLPLTPETKHIISRRTMSLLPRGAYIINAGRGGHVAEADLLHAIENDYISGATLDVFAEEPLPEDHPFWTHPKITVTPHNAADSIPALVVPQVVENIERLRRGQPLLRLVDPERGY